MGIIIVYILFQPWEESVRVAAAVYVVVQHDCNYTSATATFVSHILASMSAKPTSYNLSVKLLVVGAGTI